MNVEVIQEQILELRGQKVMLDFHLAILYEIETKVLKQAVKRNLNRFPNDFMFELTSEEFKILRSQFVTSKRRGYPIYAIYFYRTRNWYALKWIEF
ncbi:MAG: ORF6N domain-containing protein [Flavobacterium sp.]